MGKYIFFAVVALVIAFFANLFGFVDIPWLDPPGYASGSYVNKGRERMREAVDDVFEESGKDAKGKDRPREW